MTTAHRPTFDPARGKEALRGPAYHQRLLPAHTHLKHRQVGQGGAADTLHTGPRDLRAELLAAEAAVKARKACGSGADIEGDVKEKGVAGAIEDGSAENEETKRRRLILEEARDIDADSDGDDAGSDGEKDDDDADSDEEESDEEDEEAELMRELAKIKAERAAAKQAEEDAAAKKAEEQREVDIARGNPLLDPWAGREGGVIGSAAGSVGGSGSFGVKRRWDEDVVFRNQGRGTEERGKRREFVNDLLRSDFHKKFMSKYVR